MKLAQYYLVIDLEATCDNRNLIPREQTEIIEIGAVLCDGTTLEPISEFQTFVRPLRHPRLTAFCTSLTSITQIQVDQAPPFAAALERLTLWLRTCEAVGQFLFCSWGNYDKSQLTRQARHESVKFMLGPEHLNLKEEFARQASDKKKLGTKQALKRVGLPFEGTHHRGIDDARNIAKLLPWCLGRKPIPTP